MTALDPGEILTEIRIPSPGEGSGGAYLKLERKVGDYAVAGVAVQLTLDDDGKVTQAGIGLTNLGFAPIRASVAEEVLTGAHLAEAGVASGARFGKSRTRSRARLPTTKSSPPPRRPPPTPPIPSPTAAVRSKYKRNMARVLTTRAIHKALARVGG